MPIYEYQCQICCHQFELKQSFNDNLTVTCPKCQGETRRIFSPVPALFKGPGFYTTDNRKSNKPDAEQTTDKTSENDIE